MSVDEPDTAEAPFKFWDMAELLEQAELQRDWGPWRLNPATACLELHHGDGWRYEVDLERCNSTGELCDWIFQVNGKCYAEDDPDVIAGLVNALDDILEPQARLCSFGMSGSVSGEVIRRLVAEAAERWPHLCVGAVAES